MRALAADGALSGDAAQDLRWFQWGVYKPRFHAGIDGTFLSRPLLEAAVRRRVAALPNVVVRQHASVGGLLHALDRVCGVECRAADGSPAPLSANLVVDATGRGSRVPARLVAP